MSHPRKPKLRKQLVSAALGACDVSEKELRELGVGAPFIPKGWTEAGPHFSKPFSCTALFPGTAIVVSRSPLSRTMDSLVASGCHTRPVFAAIPGFLAPGHAVGHVLSLRAGRELYHPSELGPHAEYSQHRILGFEHDADVPALEASAHELVAVCQQVVEVSRQAHERIKSAVRGADRVPKRSRGADGPGFLPPQAADVPTLWLHCLHGLHRSGAVVAALLAWSEARMACDDLEAIVSRALDRFEADRNGPTLVKRPVISRIVQFAVKTLLETHPFPDWSAISSPAASDAPDERAVAPEGDHDALVCSDESLVAGASTDGLSHVADEDGPPAKRRA
jgi:hypothetical protein